MEPGGLLVRHAARKFLAAEDLLNGDSKQADYVRFKAEVEKGVATRDMPNA